jgi:tetratricopeptide (TPR) repeat protein
MNRAVTASIFLVVVLAACGRPADAPVSESESSAGVSANRAMPDAPASIAAWADGAQLFEGLGDAHRRVTTASVDAQRYFDQGMRFLWAFNHDESTRSFAKATELDPSCAICYWGVAFTAGPNYNMPMMAATRAKVAWAALAEARRHAASASPVEQGLIAALATRFAGDKPLDPSNLTPLLVAYSDAMKDLAQRYPDDVDVLTLYAESLMSIRAWRLWNADGTAAAGTDDAVKVLEHAMALDPRHPGANHYYVHALEASPHPAKALVAAERLTDMMPAAGHLVHMPAHILQQVGRYEDAAEANRKAAAADEIYFARTRAPDYYAMYWGHNYQFLAASAAMEGRSAETLAAAAAMRRVVTDEMLLAWPGYDWMYMSIEYAACLRFGRWDEMLAKPAPDARLQALHGAFLFGRAVAFAAKGQLPDARAAVMELRQRNDSIAADAPAGLNLARDVLGIAIAVAEARIADAEGRGEDAVMLLRDAIAREDKLAYNEPPDWFVPTRQILGAQLVNSGKLAEAETVYRDDLARHPENGWSLLGLALALDKQGKTSEGAIVRGRFDTAWSKADIAITSSAF